ncbi:MAG: LCP family protein [Micrococcales bacterium]
MNETPKITDDVPVIKPENARHKKVAKQSKFRAIRGILFRLVAVFAVSGIAIGAYATTAITSEIQGNSITLLSSDGKQLNEPANFDGPVNILLVGSDARAGTQGYGHVSSVLADVIILLHISADRKNVVAMSFPRDTMVPWPACPSTSGGPGYLPQSLGQINATIANGGPGCTVLTVEKLTGLKIPYLAMINFTGVIEMSNAIGGVEVCVASPIRDPYTHTILSKGKHTLMGKEALQFLRTRHGIGDGSDLSRISNQQVFLTSLVRKIKSQGVLSNPAYLYSLASSVARNMTLSSNLTDVNAIVGLASTLKDVELENITFLMLPSRMGLPAPYQGRVAPVYEKANPIFKLLRDDKPIIVKDANTYFTSVQKDKNQPTPTASPTATTSQNKELDGVYGTNAATTTCSG